MTDRDDQVPAASGALRLTLQYRDGKMTLEDSMFLAKRLPPSDPLPEGGPEGELSGFWYELQDREGRVLYREITSNPILDTWIEPVEGETRSNGAIRRLVAIPESKTFATLVPYHRGIETDLVMISSPLSGDGHLGPATEQWRIALPIDERR